MKTKRQKRLEVLSRCLRKIRNTCNRHGVQIFLDQGTLLGAIRDKTFIKDDHDIDVGTLCTDEKNFMKIKEALENTGWRVKTYKSGGKLCWLSCHIERVIVDIQVYHLINNYHCFKLKKYYVYVAPIEGLKTITFMDRKYYVPDPPERHLEQLYTNWEEKSSEYCFNGPNGISIRNGKSELLELFNTFYGVKK